MKYGGSDLLGTDKVHPLWMALFCHSPFSSTEHWMCVNNASKELMCHWNYVLFIIIDSTWLVLQFLRDHIRGILIHTNTITHDATNYAVFCNGESLLIWNYDLFQYIMVTNSIT